MNEAKQKYTLKPKKSAHYCYLDILNIIAIIAVIALHHNGGVHTYRNEASWYFNLIIECIFYFAVPVFLLITGATLMKYRERYNTKTFFKKRITKIIIPLIAWNIIYLLYSQKWPTSISDFITSFLTNKYNSHFYFMYEILGIYLTLPLLSRLARKEYHKTLWFTVGLYTLFNGLLPTILPLIKIPYIPSLSVRLCGYIIFVLLGYILSTEDLSKNQKRLIYLGAIIGVLFRFITTIVLSEQARVISKQTWGYTSWHSLLLASAIFILIKDICAKITFSEQTKKMLSMISSCSFGIYLAHALIMSLEKRRLGGAIPGYLWCTLFIPITYLFSLLVVLMIKKIPLLRKIVP